MPTEYVLLAVIMDVTFVSLKSNKKLSYRRETARQLPTRNGEGLGPPAHLASAPSGHAYTHGRIRNPQQTYVKRAVH